MVCVNCQQRRDQHHRDGWCFWLSETDYLPIRYSETAVAVLTLVDDAGRPLRQAAEDELDSSR